MRVLIFHGYLLRGTGSNVYNASLAAALAKLGHEVHLLCQERDAGSFHWPGPGSVTLHVPDIGGLLPVFVSDRYAGFEVKTFPELSDGELERYIEANVRAVRAVVEDAGQPDAALANHLVMGPVILARAGLRYALKVHGSDLSYTVIPHLERFRPYALEAARGANGILVGSEHIAERLREAVDEPDVNAKVRLGPPGVDTELFRPLRSDEARPRLRDTAEELRRVAREGGPPADARNAGVAASDGGLPRQDPPATERESSWDRDAARAATALERFAAAQGPRVVFVGKLIVSKGVDLLLAAWPLVHARHPGARLLIAGFGAFGVPLERLWRALADGELDVARDIAARGRGLEGGAEQMLRFLAGFLLEPPQGYLEAAREARDSVAFAGRLEHAEVGMIVPAADALVFPSTFPEAFGMVAAEAAAAGVLPVSAAHSGALEVSRALAGGLPPAVGPLVSFPVDEHAVDAIAERLNGWLDLDPASREDARRALAETARELWSWERVARGVVAASEGRLEDLPRV